MLKTATPTSTHSFGSAGSGGSPSADSPRGNGGSRTYLDVFNPPLDASSISPGASPVASTLSPPQNIGTGTPSPSQLQEVSCSPSNYPSSFTALAVPEHVYSSISVSGSQPTSSLSVGAQSPSLVFRGIPASPVINIRKASSSASISRDLDDFHLGEALNATQGSGSFSSGVLHHNHHQQHYHHGRSPVVGAYSPRMNQRRQMSMSEITHEDLYAPATTEEINNPDLFAQQPQNNDGPTSPPNERRSSIQDLIVPSHSIEDTLISSSIPLYEVPQDMLVPLLDRPSDMKRLLEHHSCDRQLQTLRNVVGADVYENKLLPLWTGTDRKDVSDAEWLWRTKVLILKAAGGEGGVGAREEKLWGDFCDLVGFDEEDTSIDRFGGPTGDENRAPSPQVDTMEKIGEEPEEEDVKAI
ncbi:hypothetical protein DFH27DRAFT_613870 [Peziza echinospora]|nr:hypothetical protein DFH27DRAFT_613870 [Peziza echinospora]